MGAILQLERTRRRIEDSPSQCIAVFNQERFLDDAIIDFQQYHLDLMCLFVFFFSILNLAVLN